MWLNNHRFQLAVKELENQLTPFTSQTTINSARQQVFRREPLPKIIFICGGDPKHHPNRAVMEQYLKKHSKNILTFRAEFAWETIISSHETVNALELEEWLADFSDVVIILVESFGTVAELGAFSMGTNLRKKLLPILDKNYKNDPSFINTGPVRWIDNDSRYGPSIFADFDCLLTSMPIVLERIDVKRSKVYSSRKNDKTYGELHFSRKEILFLVVLVVISIGPVEQKTVIDICKKSFNIKGSSDIGDLRFILSLTVALGLLSLVNYSDKQFFYCKSYDGLKTSDSMGSLLKISQPIRSRCLSHLVYIPEYVDFIRRISDDSL